jgi:hypothetical protein
MKGQKMTNEVQYGTEAVPFFFPTQNGSYSKTLGNLTFALSGVFSIGPHSFSHTQPITNFEYLGFRVNRRPESNVVEVVTPTGECFRFQYSPLHRTWSELRTFVQPSITDTAKYYVRDVFAEFGPVVGSLALILGTAVGCYTYVLAVCFRLLCRGWLYILIYFVAIGVGANVFEERHGWAPKVGDEPMVHAYAAPAFIILAVFAQIPIAAWSNGAIFSWRTARAAGLRILFLALIVTSVIWFGLRSMPESRSTEPRKPWVNPTDAEIQRRIEEYKERARELGVLIE